jgi:acetyltransferase
MTVMKESPARIPEQQVSYGWIGAVDTAAVWEQLRDGTTVRIRPVRPEDEPMVHDLAAHMSHEDLRLRFLAPVKGLAPVVAARLSQPDYDRDLGLLAEHDGLVLAMAHLFTDLDNSRAEYAIAVRSDWKRRGLGYLLMTRLIDIARQRGISELVGEVLRENMPMLQMCRKLGFALSSEPVDFAIIVATKRLTEAN